MPLSPAELTKLADYKTRQQKSVSATTSINSVQKKIQNEENFPDLISWCVDDILEKLEEVESYSKKENMEKNNFKSVLYSDFLIGISTNLTQDLLEMSKNSNNYYGLNTLLETENPKEFFGNLATIISFVPKLAENFVEYAVAIYLGICTKFYILADSQILSLTKSLA